MNESLKGYISFISNKLTIMGMINSDNAPILQELTYIAVVDVICLVQKKNFENNE